MWVFSKDGRLALNTDSGVVLELRQVSTWAVRSFHLSSPEKPTVLGAFKNEAEATGFYRRKLREAKAIEEEAR